jgi:hypothetical protein
MTKPAFLHPDHLLDGARRGVLPPEDRRRLAAHLAVCSACTWEQAAVDDFAREHAGAVLDSTRLSALVEGTMVAAGLVPAHRPAPASASRRWLAAAAMAAAILAVFAASSREAPAHGGASIAVTEASLDAGALGAPSGGDS